MRNLTLTISILFLGTTISCLESSVTQPITFEDQLSKDLEIIDAYLAENEITAEVHSSDIRYVIDEEGTGDSPTATDSVKVIYEARLLEGNAVDSNVEGITFKLNQLILAWQIMIPLMSEGGKMTIYAPSVYCYGNVRRGAIPPNANLIFDIELVEVIRD